MSSPLSVQFIVNGNAEETYFSCCLSQLTLLNSETYLDVDIYMTKIMNFMKLEMRIEMNVYDPSWVFPIETKLILGFQLHYNICIGVASLQNLIATTTSRKNQRLANAILFPVVSTTYEKSGRNALVTKLAEGKTDKCLKRFKRIYFDNYPLTFKQELIV